MTQYSSAKQALTWLSLASADVEDITAKTGNYKKFNVFVRMLISAIHQESESVFVDLLTYADLETLKSKKGAGQAPLKRTIPPNNKRYLILTYAAEFDRVHYPLPLLFEEPTVQHLQSVVQQLRQQLVQAAGKAAITSSKAKHLGAMSEMSRFREHAVHQQLQQDEQLQQQPRSTASPDVDELRAKQAESQQEILLVRCHIARLSCHTHSNATDICMCPVDANMRASDMFGALCVMAA